MADVFSMSATVAAPAPPSSRAATAYESSSKAGFSAAVVFAPRLAGRARLACRNPAIAATCSRFHWKTNWMPDLECYLLAEVPIEVLEDAKFVQLNDDDPRFGPPALLLLGFRNDEGVKVQKLLRDMEGDFMQVLLCTKEMVSGTLGKAVNAVQPNLLEVEVADGLPRISFISGLTGEEIMTLIQVFPEAGLEATVFAAHVPLNSEKSITELTEEIMDDHRRLQPGEDTQS